MVRSRSSKQYMAISWKPAGLIGTGECGTMQDVSTRIDLPTGEFFPHLANAPIVEAVLEFRTRAGAGWVKEAVLAELERALPEYSEREAQGLFHAEFRHVPSATSEERMSDLGWVGFRVRTADGMRVGDFQRDSFRFAWLGKYDTWDAFQAEGFRLWQIHRATAAPAAVHRLGVRFINRIELEDGENVEDVLANPPAEPPSVHFRAQSFLDHRQYAVPGTSYSVTVIRALEPGTDSSAVILDVDASTEVILEEDSEILDHLPALRWLKNQMFHSIVKPICLEKLSR